MQELNEITKSFGRLFHPVKALLIYNSAGGKDSYVEAYDMDRSGCAINAHRLSLRESISLAKALDTSEELKQTFLKPEGLLPKKVLYINPDRNGYAVWSTPPHKVKLLFLESLGIPSGEAAVPALVWKANRSGLWLYASTADKEIQENTPLYHAPFFNIGNEGKVCMGTVNINLPADCGLEKFIKLWEDYFFNSYFSHLLGDNPVKGNIVQLWQKLVKSGKPFPAEVLIKYPFTLKKIIR